MGERSDPVGELQAAARRVVARFLPGTVPVSVTVADANGQTLFSVGVPVGASGDAVEPCESAVESGWLIGGKRATFEGRPIPVSGRKLDVLRVLVAHEIAGLDELRKAWGEYPAEDSTIHWTVAELRKALAKAFDLEEPIAATGSGYTLLVR